MNNGSLAYKDSFGARALRTTLDYMKWGYGGLLLSFVVYGVYSLIERLIRALFGLASPMGAVSVLMAVIVVSLIILSISTRRDIPYGGRGAARLKDSVSRSIDLMRRLASRVGFH